MWVQGVQRKNVEKINLIQMRKTRKKERGGKGN